MTEAETFNTIVQNTSAREEPPRAVTFVNEEARKQLDKLLDDIEITEDKGKRPLTADERNWVITMLKNAAVYNAKPKENPELKRYSQLAKPTGIAVELDKDGAINEVSMPEPGTPRWNETRNWLVNYLASEGG